MDETEQTGKLNKKERRALKKRQKKEARQKQRHWKNLKQIGLWLTIFLGLVGFILFIRSSNSPISNQPSLSVDKVASSDHWKGNAQTKILLVEYSDFQCPACGYYYSLLKQLDQEFGDKIQFVYRNFPLTQIHRNAERAAYAAEAAGKQGKFWEMHNLIFEGQKDWSKKRNAKLVFIKYARFLNLDEKKFRADMKSKDIRNKVRNDYNSGLKAGVNSTPSFFLNGKKFQNPRDYKGLKKIISEAFSQ